MFTGSEDYGVDCVDCYICTSSLEYKLNLAPPLSKSDPKAGQGMTVQDWVLSGLASMFETIQCMFLF